LAGYFFNDGVVRIAVAFEHLVRQETNLYRYERFEQMRTQAIAEGFTEEWMGSWRSIDEELIRIRHRNTEFVDGPLVTHQKAVASLDHLAQALEWAINRHSTSR
jgi:hypothetical protein